MSGSGPSHSASRETAMLAWIHEFAPYGVITTDTRFRIQSWNRWMTAHTGRTLEEVSQQPLLELFPEIEERRLLPRLERALEGESSLLSTALHSYILRLDSPVRHPAFPQMQQTGRIAPLLFQKETIGVIIVVEDVTQREIQSYLLRQQHDRDRLLSWALAHLLTSEEPRRTVRELFYKVAEYSDFDGYLLYLFDGNAGAYRLQSAGGVTPEQEETLSGLDPSSPLANLLLSSSEPRAWERLQENPQSPLGRELGFSMTALLPLVGSRGQFGLLCFGSRSRPALNENELELLSTIGKYLAVALQKEFTTTQLHAAQNKLNQHAQELERQVAERTASLCDIIAELETFSYTLSHDLRAPIRSLIGYSEVLIEDYANILPEEGKLVIQRLNRACSQLDALTRDLLEFSKVSRQDIRLVPVHLDALVQDIVSLFPAAQGRLSVKRPLDPVLAHPGLLQQCIANLIDNALKFVKAGQLAKISLWTELCVSDREPTSTLQEPFTSAKSPPSAQPAGSSRPRPAPPRVRIYVEDQGIGIAPESQAKIFGVFERGISSLEYPGSGIGLAIVTRAVQRMGGSCGVQSTPDVGSRFWLELPAAS